MSFQWIIDNAEQLSINRKKMVGTTTARDGITRTVVRGTIPDVITVKLPDGLKWSTFRSSIESAETLDRISTSTITIPYDKFPWFYSNVDPITDKSYTVQCLQFPEWTIFSRDQVSWSGAFVFQEVLP